MTNCRDTGIGKADKMATLAAQRLEMAALNQEVKAQLAKVGVEQ